MRSACKVLVGKAEGKISLGTPTCKGEQESRVRVYGLDWFG
jgi:hypothetical protein